MRAERIPEAQRSRVITFRDRLNALHGESARRP